MQTACVLHRLFYLYRPAANHLSAVVPARHKPGKLPRVILHSLLFKIINTKPYYPTAENNSDIHPACWPTEAAR